MKTRQRTNNAASLTAAAFLLLAFCLWRPAEVRAQWATNGNDINNTNTGNIGVGTTAPVAKLDVTNSEDKAQVRFGMGSGNSGGFLFSNGPGHAVFSGGTGWNGGWIARSMSASFLQLNGGSVSFFGNTGLTSGSTYTPTELMRITPSGNVGIGTTNPTRLLEISAASTNASTIMASTAALGIFNTNTTAGNTSDLTFRTFDSGGVAVTPAKVVAVFTNHTANAVSGDLAFVTMIGSAGVERMRVTGGGNVGIGTAAPGTRLHVNGTTLSGITAGTSGDYGARSLMLTTRPLNDGVASLGFDANGAYRGAFDFNGGSGLLAWYTNGGSGWSPSFVISAGGTVGIGTTSPNSAYKLDVLGSVNASGLCFGGDCKTAWSQVGGSQWTTSGTSVYYNTGNVGIGTASPASWRKLHVLGGNVESQWSATAGQGYGFYIARDNNHFAENAYFDGSAWRAIQSGKSSIIQTYTSGGYALYVQADNTVRAADAARTFSPVFAVKMDGSLGIGTTTPLQKLQIGSNTVAGSTTPDAISLGATYSTVAGANPKIRLWDDTANVYGMGVSSSQFDFMIPTGSRYVWNVNGAEKMRLDSSGNVGIGTTPGASYKLDVNGQAHVSGDMTVDGNIAAKYQDVAEWVPSTQKLAAGTVVVLDTGKINHVQASTKAYDTAVAGVVSDTPGIILGQGDGDKLKVATTGRVKVKVDATRAPIKVGDLLVTSDMEGVAMKSTEVDLGGVKIHRPGTIIGKALEPLDKGTGEILVLLSLQ
jgi:hypothetical protein